MGCVREIFGALRAGWLRAWLALWFLISAVPLADELSERATTIDLLVLYTPEVRQQEGQAGAEAKIRLCLAYLDEALRQSLIPVRVRLVYLGEAIWHRDTGSVPDELGWLMADPVVEELRDRYGADLVALRVLPGTGVRGMATFGPAYSVWTGAPRVFAHEIGHNLGLGHARHEAGSCTPVYPFGYGHIAVPPRGNGQRQGTIMSSVPGPPLFSNPSVNHLGAPMGVPIGRFSQYGVDLSADASRAITLMATEIAALRPTRVARLAGPQLSVDGGLFRFRVVSTPGEPCGVEWTDNYLDWHFLADATSAAGLKLIEDSVGGVEVRCYRVWEGGRLAGRQLGFLQRALPAGVSVIANPFDDGVNTLEELFPDWPEGSQISKWDESALAFQTSVFSNQAWSAPTMTLHPGEGAVIHLTAAHTLRLTGWVQDAFYRNVAPGWSLRGAPLPWRGELVFSQGFPAACGSHGQTDIIFTWRKDRTGYQPWVSVADGWSPKPGPEPRPGEGFWCYKFPNAHLWSGVFWPGTASIR
jgi:hypothetical protein